MKKFFYVLILLVFITGCDIANKLDNTPTKRIETLLNKYQTLDTEVLDSLDKVVSDETLFNDDQKSTYRDIIKKNYNQMTYKIKDEEIDGDGAVVTVEIEVIDYSKVLSEAYLYKNEHEEEFMDDDNNYSETKFIDYRLEKLKQAKDKVKYTLEFTLTKVDEDWIIDDLTKENEAKLNGVYSY